jgi:hypothetical protein
MVFLSLYNIILFVLFGVFDICSFVLWVGWVGEVTSFELGSTESTFPFVSAPYVTSLRKCIPVFASLSS